MYNKAKKILVCVLLFVVYVAMNIVVIAYGSNKISEEFLAKRYEVYRDISYTSDIDYLLYEINNVWRFTGSKLVKIASYNEYVDRYLAIDGYGEIYVDGDLNNPIDVHVDRYLAIDDYGIYGEIYLDRDFDNPIEVIEENSYYLEDAKMQDRATEIYEELVASIKEGREISYEEKGLFETYFVLTLEEELEEGRVETYSVFVINPVMAFIKVNAIRLCITPIVFVVLEWQVIRAMVDRERLALMEQRLK